jgi:hypothetical protein
MIFLPPPTEPVKQTFAMSGLRINADILASGPVTTFSTPGGSWSARRCTTRVVASGAVTGGFTMTLLPASSACGNEAPRMAMGQLKGTMIDTTPNGWLRHRGLHWNGTGNGRQHFRHVDLIGMAQRELPADFQNQRIDPGLEADLAVLLRQDRGVRIAVRTVDALQRGIIFSARCCGVRAAQAG